jgi:preprotein translocase subunit YajC
VLDFLISPAYAQATAPAPSPWPTILMFAFLIVIMFVMFRSQSKRAKEQREMLAKLAKGDEAVTTGGLTGVIRDIGENFLTFEIADGVNVKLQKHAIASVLPKGTLKAL